MSPKTRGHFAHVQTVCTRPSFCGLVARLFSNTPVVEGIDSYCLHVLCIIYIIHVATCSIIIDCQIP